MGVYRAVIIDCFNISSAELCRINCGGVWHISHANNTVHSVYL